MSYFNQVVPFDPQIGYHQRISPTGPAMVEMPTRLVGSAFTATLSSNQSDNFWVTARGTSSTATTGLSLGTLTSGTVNADWCSLASQRRARFLFVEPNRWRCIARFAAVTAANTNTYLGAMSLSNGAPQDGYCFKVDGSGVVSCQAYTGASAILNVASGFNGELGSTYTLPDTNAHQFDIFYLYAHAYYFIDQMLLHKATPTDTQYSTQMTNPIGLSVVNGTSPTSRVVQIWSSSILRMGKEVTRPSLTYIVSSNGAGQILKTGPGTLHRVVLGQPVNAASVALYDAVSATNPIALLTSGSATALPATLEFGTDFATGLFCVTTGTNGQTTVIYD